MAPSLSTSPSSNTALTSWLLREPNCIISSCVIFPSPSRSMLWNAASTSSIDLNPELESIHKCIELNLI